jgi:hypothetical protein
MYMSPWTIGIGIYILLLITLIVVHARMRRSHTTLVRHLIGTMDGLVGQYTRTLYAQRDQIHDYENNV